MDFVKQYLKIISYVCSGLVFAFAVFYLLANLYHYFELRKDYISSFDNQFIVQDMDESLSRAKNNISSFNPNTYHGKVSTNDMQLVKNEIEYCINSFNNDTLKSMRGKNRITILDVYNLRNSYENNILSDCVVKNLHWLTTVDESFGSTYLVNNREITTLYVESLLGATTYLKKDLLNNSSYYYNTAIASTSNKDVARDGFFEVMDAYNKAAKFVEYVSSWFKMEAEG